MAVSTYETKRKYQHRKHDEIMAEFRKDGCAVCGESRPYVLHAHHVLPGIAKQRINRLRRNGSFGRMREELKKCICLCAHCHMEHHHYNDNKRKVAYA